MILQKAVQSMNGQPILRATEKEPRIEEEWCSQMAGSIADIPVKIKVPQVGFTIRWLFGIIQNDAEWLKHLPRSFPVDAQEVFNLISHDATLWIDSYLVFPLL